MYNYEYIFLGFKGTYVMFGTKFTANTTDTITVGGYDYKKYKFCVVSFTCYYVKVN